MTDKIEIDEEKPRLVKEVKTFGGNDAYVSVPGDFAEVGDKVLLVNLNGDPKKEEQEDPNEIVEEKCCRCGHEWEGKRSEKPTSCPECKLVPWERPECFKPPAWKNRGIRVTEQKVEKPPEEEE